MAVTFVSPLSLLLPALPIQEEGVYAFEVVCEGEILGTYRITAEEIKPPAGATAPPV